MQFSSLLFCVVDEKISRYMTDRKRMAADITCVCVCVRENIYKSLHGLHITWFYVIE